MTQRPNIVYVLTDDQGYGDLGCHGNPIINTPNIDQFYSESLRLTDFHVGPTCAPTRSGLMTGHFANSTGVWHTVGGRSLLRSNEVTLATALKDEGYRTGIFGKWHLGDDYPYRPMDRGFEETVVHGGGGISQTPDYWGNDYFDDTYYANGEAKKYNGYCTDVFFEEALGFIERHKDEPFFCYIPTNAPHGPFNVEDTYSKPYLDQTNKNRASFYGMITNIDDNFARLRVKLEALGLTENTIIIFMTDNGTSCGFSGDVSGYVKDGYNGGLRGGKNSEYDGGHRVPFFIKWPEGKIGGGKDFDYLSANVDFMPTLLDMCQIQRDDLDFHGLSLLPAMKGKAMKKRTLVTDSQRLAYPMKWRKSAVMTQDWRLVNGRELYAINEDREQRNEISDRHPEVVKQLRGEYEKWWALVSEQFDEMIPYIVGDRRVTITGHDLRNEECKAAWNQKLIREGLPVDGYYEIEVEEEGDYRFGIRRWPKSTNLGIRKGIEGKDVEIAEAFIQKDYLSYYRDGKALDVAYTQIHVQDQTEIVEVQEEDVESTFILALKKGQTKLYTRFLDQEKFAMTAAYYVEISKIGGQAHE